MNYHIQACTPLLSSRHQNVLGWLLVFGILCSNLISIVFQFTGKMSKLLSIVYLNIVDGCMSISLIMLLVSDSQFGAQFPLHKHVWTTSTACKIISFFQILTINGSRLVLLFIVIERFIIVTYPFDSGPKLRFSFITMNIFLLISIGLSVVVIPLGTSASIICLYLLSGVQLIIIYSSIYDAVLIFSTLFLSISSSVTLASTAR